MFIPRADGETDNCLDGYSNCTPSFAIVGTDPSDMESSSEAVNPADYEKSGSHRFIGIGMVVGMVFIVLGLWWTFAKWPRRMRRKHLNCWRSQDAASDEAMGEQKQEIATIISPQPAGKRKKSSRGSSGEPREKSASLATFSDTKKTLGSWKGVEHHIVTDWDLEHVHGVRYEARTPKRDSDLLFETPRRPPRAVRKQ